MRTAIDYEVRFTLEGDELFVVPGRRPHTYVRVDYVAVTLHGDSDRLRVHVSGHRCRRDGGEDRRMGRSIEGVDLPAADITAWVRRAWGVVANRERITEAEHRYMMVGGTVGVT